jgi:hypothetical protein
MYRIFVDDYAKPIEALRPDFKISPMKIVVAVLQVLFLLSQHCMDRAVITPATLLIIQLKMAQRTTQVVDPHINKLVKFGSTF